MSRGKDGKKGSHTRRTVLALMGVFAVLTAAFSVAAGLTGRDPWIAFSLVCGTTLYHIVMRLAVGTAVKKGAGRLRPDGFWFRPKKFEAPLYRFLRVGEWKKFAPTYDPARFDMRRHTPDELIRSTCAAELTHEIAAAAGWLTLVFSPFHRRLADIHLDIRRHCFRRGGGGACICRHTAIQPSAAHPSA